MKKLVLIFLLAITFQTFSQETVHFKMHYKPETTYISEGEMKMKNTIYNSGSDSYMNYFRENNIDSITVVHQSVKPKIELKVLSTDEQGILPVEMKYISLEIDGVEITEVNGLTTLGTIQDFSVPVFHSVEESNFKADFDEEFLFMINQMFKQIKFPNVALAIDESYQDTMPFVIPIENFEMKMEVNSEYLLKKIIDHRALIELTQSGKINFTENDKNFEGHYTGSGYFFYDLNHDYIQETKLTYFFEINYFSNYNNLKILTDADYSQKMKIEN